MRDSQLSLATAEKIDVVCDRFEQELIATRNARIEDYLPLGDARWRTLLLGELLRIEFAQRTDWREQVDNFVQPGLVNRKRYGSHCVTAR